MTKNFREKAKFVTVVAVTVIVMGTGMGMLKSKASEPVVDVPEKVVCNTEEKVAIYQTASLLAEETGYYIYPNHTYEFVKECENGFYEIEYYDDNYELCRGYCRKDNFGAVEIGLAVDVSHYQEKINWKKVAKSSVGGVKVSSAIIKIGQTSTAEKAVAFSDEKFEYNVENAIKNGLKTGVYFYSKATTVSQAEAEADWVIRKIEEYDIKGPVAFDYEDPCLSEISQGIKTEVCKAFMNKVKLAGYEGVIYSNQSFLIEQLEMEELNKYSFWVARYSENQPVVGNPVMWQYTDQGSVDGITGNVDLNWVYEY